MAERKSPATRFEPRIQDLKKSESRRLAILEATVEAIAEEGVHNLSAFSLGKRTKMRRSHIVYYFPNQDLLIENAIRYAVEIGQRFTLAAMEKAHTPDSRLEAWLDGSIGWLANYPAHRSVMTLLHHFATFMPNYQKLQQEIADTGEARIISILQARAGSKAKATAAYVPVARTIRAIMVGELIRYFTTASPEKLANLRTHLKKQIFELADSVSPA